MAFELKPMNKHIVLDPIAEDEKVAGGLLYRPSNTLEKQHRLAKVVAVSQCDELGDLKVGDTVLYDAIGSVSHRVANQSFTTVRILNVIAIVREHVLPVTKFEDILRVTETPLPPLPAPPALKETSDGTVEAVSEEAKARLIELALTAQDYDMQRAKPVGVLEVAGSDELTKAIVRDHG